MLACFCNHEKLRFGYCWTFFMSPILLTFWVVRGQDYAVFTF